MSRILYVAAICAGALFVAACSSGSGNGGPPQTYSIGGTVTGLTGSGLVLQNNGGNDLSVAASGPFSFSTQLAGAAAYSVTVLTQPANPAQTCTVTSGGSGTVTTSNVTTIAVSCVTNSYTVGGTVSGLNGTGLVLQNNSANDLAVAANGPFSFSAPVASGNAYAVTVSAQPTGAGPERCTVANGSGVMVNAAVTTVTITCAPPSAKFLYVPNQASNEVSAYALDATTGTLTPVPGSPFATAASPTVASANPLGKFLYVSSRGSATTPPVLTAYSIDASTGSLAPLNGSPFALSVVSPPTNGQVLEIGRLRIHPSGLFGYLTIPFPTGRLFGLAINPTTGELTEIAGMPVALGHTLYTGTFDSAGRVVYFPHITNGLPIGVVQSYQVNEPSGVLTPIGSFDILGRGSTVAVLTPGGTFLLTPNIFTGSISVMAVNAMAGTLTSVAGSPVNLGLGTEPFALVVHSNNFVYVTSSASPTVFAFRLNPATAAMTPIPGSPYTVGASPLGPAILEPRGRFLYIPQRTGSTIEGYSIDQANGALTPVPGGPFATGGSPSAIADPSGRFLFVSNAASGTVASYSIDATTGALALVNTVPAGQSPQLAEIVVQ
jgi:6-phosphogluconolactonase (cycloisomerase 2 family)